MIEHVVGRADARARITRRVIRTVMRPTLTIFPIRGPLARIIPLLDVAARPLPRSLAVDRTRLDAPTWSAEHIVPKGSVRSEAAVIYMHGGAFVFCGLNTHRQVADGLALASGVQVLNVNYRQHPRGTVADAVDDCLEAFAWLLAEGVDPAQVVLAGDSAGGHLAFAVGLALRDLGYPTAGIIGFSPWVDFDHTNKTGHANRRTDAMIPARRLQGIARAVLGADVELHHSPVNADLTGLPPVLMMVADDEVLLPDAELMRERLMAHGVPVRLQIWSDVMHAFPAVPVPLADVRRARAVAGSFIRTAIRAAASADRSTVA